MSKTSKVVKHPIPKDGPHQYGFGFAGLMDVTRACQSRAGEKRRWAAVRIFTHTGGVDIEATPRKTHVRQWTHEPPKPLTPKSPKPKATGKGVGWYQSQVTKLIRQQVGTKFRVYHRSSTPSEWMPVYPNWDDGRWDSITTSAARALIASWSKPSGGRGKK